MTPPTRATGRKKKPNDPWATPAMRQYRRFKDAHPECVLFFRMGDFYEMFDDDARVVSKAIGLTLTQRTTGIDMAGVPHHSADGYLRRLVNQGFRVAVCEQLEDPSQSKGVVDRGVTRVITPGTLVDAAMLDDAQHNRLIALSCCGDDVLVAAAEVSTGEIELHRIPRSSILDELDRLASSEIIVSESDEELAEALSRYPAAINRQPPWCFSAEEGRHRAYRQWDVGTVAGFGMTDDDPLLSPLGALLGYLSQTQAGEDTSTLSHLSPPRVRQSSAFVAMDGTTLRSLEVEQTIRGGTIEGSLLGVLQHCHTPMGKRLLRQWLREPLADRAAIESRQDVVATLLDESVARTSLAGTLHGMQDVARITGRVATGRATPRDITALGSSLRQRGAVAEQLAHPSLQRFRSRLETVGQSIEPLADQIVDACVDAPPAHLREGGMFRDGIDVELDEARLLQRDAGSWLGEYQAELVEETGIASLKIGFNKVFGYYIEVTHAHTDKVPDAFTRKQTLKNAERYITPPLKEFEDKVTTAEARAVQREQELFADLCNDIALCTPSVVLFSEAIAELDALVCFADVAARFGYVRPTLTDDTTLDIKDGRHPVLDRLLAERFVPNSCTLDPATLALITGPNMAGKSTFIRQVALITLMAHTGCFVPAASATIGVVDRIFTRVGASDELHAGQSTFMVEMVETANILNNATSRSLVILDEIGRGTSTLDGLSLAWAIAEALADRACRTLFATHYHELTTLADRLSSVANLHVTVREWNDRVVFLYHIEPGHSDRSYGIHVAQIAGVPADVVARANALLDTLTVHTRQASDESATSRTPLSQGDLFCQ
ncbi:MAG: DNA mismatch repair protein MutS [Phycisphaerales bacterium]|nr:DNA mismatch repair protein MutS [Phycisphaerales bacterium]